MIIIVAGVAGSGKTAVGAMVAGKLRWRFTDTDTFHPRPDIGKTDSGKPLTDEERAPWLEAITQFIDERLAAGQSAIVTCSALTRSSRDLLLDGRPSAIMAFLTVDPGILLQRATARPGHSSRELVESQLDALEMPSPTEEPRVRVIAADGGSFEIADKVIAAVWPDGPKVGPGHAAT